MATANETKAEITGIIRFLIVESLADDQSFPFERRLNDGFLEISFEGSEHISVALHNQEYEVIYDQLVASRAYNVKMLDGGLLQMLYRYDGSRLISHRLAFFPSPYLHEFQANPDIYINNVVFAEVVASNVVPVPLRFDYNLADQGPPESLHPRVHLTLGQYRNCRIPVSSPLTPTKFVDFVLRNFYNSAHHNYVASLPIPRTSFPDSIRPDERRIVHVEVSQSPLQSG